MAKLISSVCVLVFFLIIDDSYPASTKYVSYNSSDLSYLSNGIQFPVLPMEDHDPIIDELMPKNLPHQEWMSQLYNHHNWKKRLVVVENAKCRLHLSTYITHLVNGTLWAVKMNDASGRYSSQFFFGNDFWLGSKTQCEELGLPGETVDVPSFPVHFYVAKIRINVNDNLTPVTRQLNLGQCLPSSCGLPDVRRLLVQERSQASALNVVGVRRVPGDYSLLHDFKFHIIGGIGLLMLLIVIIASALDYCRKTCSNTTSIEEANNNNNNNNNDNDNKEIAKRKDKCKATQESSPTALYMKLILCFSAIVNAKKILNVDAPPKSSVNCIHGLRFFSIAWIILVHSYLEVFAIADNKSIRVVTERMFFYQTISNATFSVDTFFFISGLLITITFLRKEFKKDAAADQEEVKKDNLQKSVLRYFLLVLYRYIRLTPAYLFVLGLNEVVMRYYHNFSVFSPAIIDHISCTQFWWRNALYINNFFPQREFCMLWSWYMSNDTQFFVIAIALLTIAVRNERCFKWVVGAVAVFMISSWITTFTIAMQYKYVARIEEPFALFDELYDKPWLRIGPYLVGMATGYALLKLDYKLPLPKPAILLGWVLSIACLFSLVYGLGKDGLVVPVSAFYAALGHTAWGLSIAWITLACTSGYGGIVNSTLSFRGLLPLSRLTYCAYLIHPMLMCISSFEMDGPMHLHNGITVVIYCGNAVVSFIVAFLISLCFEAPFVRMLKVISSRDKN